MRCACIKNSSVATMKTVETKREASQRSREHRNITEDRGMVR